MKTPLKAIASKANPKTVSVLVLGAALLITVEHHLRKMRAENRYAAGESQQALDAIRRLNARPAFRFFPER